MELISPDDSVDQIRQRLPNDGRRFVLRDALNALDDFYSHVRFDEFQDDDDSIIVVAGKFGDNSNRRFEIGLYRSFGLMRQLEILLRYPRNLRSLFINCVVEFCESPQDSEQFFVTLRASRWIRRYATIAASDCWVRWRDEEEMATTIFEIAPKLMDALGPNL